MKLFSKLFLPIPFLVMTALPSLSATANEHTCGFVTDFQKSKSKAIQTARNIFGHANEQVQNSIAGSMGGLPEKFDDGQVIEIANVGGLLVEHFIVLNSSSIGNIYFRIVYEKVGKNMAGVKFVVNSDVEVALDDWPMLQNPINVQC